MSKTKIEWTENRWNPITGCDKVSAGCKNCYAEGIAKRFWGERKFTDVRVHHTRFDEPFSWRKPKMVFVNSMSDLFHEKVGFEDILQIFDVMCTAMVLKCKKCRDWRAYHLEKEFARDKYSQNQVIQREELLAIEQKYKLDQYHDETEECYREVPKHTYQILTKRPERAVEFFKWLKEENSGDWNMSEEDHPLIAHLNDNNWVLPDNIWMGVSAENQEQADKRIPILLKDIPAKVKWVSAEPLLGSLLINGYLQKDSLLSLIESRPVYFEQKGEKPIDIINITDRLDWVVVGCESGSKKRVCHVEWVNEIVRECISANVPVFVKQLQLFKGGWKKEFAGGWTMKDVYVEKNIEKFPEHLRLRLYPGQIKDVPKPDVEERAASRVGNEAGGENERGE